MDDTYNILTTIGFLIAAWVSTLIMEFCYCEWKRGNYMDGIRAWRKLQLGWKGGDLDGKAAQGSSQEDCEARCTPSPAKGRQWWRPQDQ